MEEKQSRVDDRTAILLACFLGFTGANNFYVGSPVDAFIKYILGLLYILVSKDANPLYFLCITGIISVIEALFYTLFGAMPNKEMWDKTHSKKDDKFKNCVGRKKYVVLVSVYAVITSLFCFGLLFSDLTPSDTNSQDALHTDIAQTEEVLPSKKTANLDNGIVGVTWFDVGDDSSQLIYLPDDTCALIAPADEASAKTVVERLQEKDVDRLDYLIVLGTEDSDIKGAQYIDAHLPSDSLWVSQTNNIEKDAFANTSIHEVSRLDEIDSGDEFSLAMKAENNLSPYVLATYKATEFVFAKDLQPLACEDTESLKKDTLVSLSGTCNSDLSEKVIPEVVQHTVLSFGEDKDSLPSYELMKQMGKTEIFGTGSNGVIVATSDGEEIDVKVEKDAAVEFSPAKVEVEEPDESQESSSQADSSKDDSYSSSTSDSSSDSSASQDSSHSSETTNTQGSNNESVSSADDNSHTVYLTNSGKKYHEDGCRFLRKSKIPTTLGEVKAKGIKPCSVCH